MSQVTFSVIEVLPAPRSLCHIHTKENLGRPAVPMSEYSIGIEDHYAWANLVSVTTSGPSLAARYATNL